MRYNNKIEQLYKKAKQLGCCDIFTGKETEIKEIVTLLMSPQGIEFCVKNGFPSLDDFRYFGNETLNEYGIYVDSGYIFLDNPKNVIIVGDTKAHICCNSTNVHNIIVIHGATCIVRAKLYSIVHVQKDNSSVVSVLNEDFARVIQ